MNIPSVYFTPFATNDVTDISTKSKALFQTFLDTEHIPLKNEIPIKVHTGEPGNDTFINPVCYNGIIDLLQSKKIQCSFIETNVAYGGPRSAKETHLQVTKDHGFTRLPFVIADNDGFDHIEVPVPKGKHFRTCKIAKELANKEQVLVMTHFKGHAMAGFGGAIKMLGIGFASARGKSEIHAAYQVPEEKLMDWSHWKMDDAGAKTIFNAAVVHSGIPFFERVAESAYAAHHGKQHIYVTYAMNLTADCDCEGNHMLPIYPNLGIFISVDPVAIDSAVMDMLLKREQKTPFLGSEILPYAESIGLGSQKYTLHTF